MNTKTEVYLIQRLQINPTFCVRLSGPRHKVLLTLLVVTTFIIIMIITLSKNQ